MNLIFVAVGGGLGALCRYNIGLHVQKRQKGHFPIATFVINIAGAFLLGVWVHRGGTPALGLLWVDGFLGGFTTFSTLMVESVHLARDSRRNAAEYIALSLGVGILGYLLGTWI
jgi:CrcB protein